MEEGRSHFVLLIVLVISFFLSDCDDPSVIKIVSNKIFAVACMTKKGLPMSNLYINIYDLEKRKKKQWQRLKHKKKPVCSIALRCTC